MKRLLYALPFVYYSVRAQENTQTGNDDDYEVINVGEDNDPFRSAGDYYEEYVSENTDSGTGFEEAPVDNDIDDDDEIAAMCDDQLADIEFASVKDEEDAFVACALDAGWKGDEDQSVTYDCDDVAEDPQCSMRSAEAFNANPDPWFNNQFPQGHNDPMEIALLNEVFDILAANRTDTDVDNYRSTKEKKECTTRRRRQCHEEEANEMIDAAALRRGRRNRRKNKQKKKTVPKKPVVHSNDKVAMFHGGISAFTQGIVSFTSRTADNCDQGWHADAKTCANTCRVKWIAGNPMDNYDDNEQHFYRQNPEYARCEACLMWSKLPGKWKLVSVQKSLYKLKAGAPAFCDPNTSESCKLKEHTFAACMGTSVCANECWTKKANPNACRACKDRFCMPESKVNEGVPWFKKEFPKFFKLCQEFDKCYSKYPPQLFNEAKSSNRKMLLAGINCWGTPMDPELRITKEDFYTTLDYCGSVTRGWSLPYPDYITNHGKCIDGSCTKGEKYYSQTRCNDYKCSKVCLNGAGFSEDCLKCKYKLKNPRTDRCKRDKTYRDCNIASIAYNCYEDCEIFAKQRNLRGDPAFEQKTYEEYMEKCAQDRCHTYFPKTCGQCIDKCEDQGERKYETALGTNHFRKNFEGWGCLNLCKAKNIINLARQDKNEYDPEKMTAHIAATMSGGTDSHNAQATIVNNNKRKKRTRKPRRRGKRDTIRQRLQKQFK